MENKKFSFFYFLSSLIFYQMQCKWILVGTFDFFNRDLFSAHQARAGATSLFWRALITLLASWNTSISTRSCIQLIVNINLINTFSFSSFWKLEERKKVSYIIKPIKSTNYSLTTSADKEQQLQNKNCHSIISPLDLDGVCQQGQRTIPAAKVFYIIGKWILLQLYHEGTIKSIKMSPTQVKIQGKKIWKEHHKNIQSNDPRYAAVHKLKWSITITNMLLLSASFIPVS